MKTQVMKRFKEIFEKEKESLLFNKRILNEDFYIQGDELMDEADRTRSELEQFMKIRLRNREALYLKKIDAALKRIKGGTFGECLDCGDEIEPRRLEARPTTTLCLSCKEAQENQERVFVEIA